jgi:peptidoglycan/LPS O-acetylase OafA/YrhL
MTLTSISSLLVCIYASILSETSSPFLYGTGFVFFAYTLGVYKNPILVNRFTAHLGKVSFSAYLIHFPLARNAAQLVRHGLMIPLSSRGVLLPVSLEYVCVLSLTVLVTALIASLTFTYVEKPGIGVGKRIVAALENRGSVCAS